MAVLASMIINGTVTGPTSGVPLSIIGTVTAASADESKQPTISGTVDNSIIDNVLPRDEGRHQIVGIPIVELDGVAIPAYKLMPDLEVVERIDGARSFSFGIAAHSDFETDTAVSPTRSTEYGDLFGPDWIPTWTGAPPGLQDIDIYWLVPLTTGFSKVQLISKGIVDNAELTYGPGGAFWQINGTGQEQRVDRQTVDLVFPPGSGVTLGNVVASLLELLPGLSAANVPDFRSTVQGAIKQLIGADRRYKEIIVKDQPGWQVANEILSLFNARVQFSRDGDLEIIFLGERQSDIADWSLTLADLTADGITFSPANDGPTAIRVTGHKQIVSEDESSTRQLQTQQIRVQQVYGRHRPPQEIADTAGNLISSGLSDAQAIFRTVQIVNIFRTLQAGEVLSEKSETWGFYNEEVDAGDMQADGTISYIVAQEIDRDSRAVHQSIENWQLLQRESTSYFYEDFTFPQTDPAVIPDTVGVLKTIFRKRLAHYNPRKRLGVLGTGGAIAWSSGQAVLFNGEGVSQLQETIQNVEFEKTTFDVDDNLMLNSETTKLTKYFVKPGNTYYYATGETSSSVSEVFQEFSRKIVSYAGIGSSGHSRTTTEKTAKGQFKVTTEAGQGFKPAASVIDAIAKPPNFDPEFARFTSRELTEYFEVLYQSAALEKNRQPREEIVSSPWIENQAEGMFWAGQLVKEQSAIPCAFSMPVNPLMRVGQKISLDLGIRKTSSRGIHEIYPEEVRIARTREGSFTDVTGKVYVT